VKPQVFNDQPQLVGWIKTGKNSTISLLRKKTNPFIGIPFHRQAELEALDNEIGPSFDVIVPSSVEEFTVSPEDTGKAQELLKWSEQYLMHK
jgi:hypothetical protein